MRRPSASALAIERALATTANAMRNMVISKRRPRSWRSDLAALRDSLAALSSARAEAGEIDHPIGFLADSEESYEMPSHGLDEDHEHEADTPAASRKR